MPDPSFTTLITPSVLARHLGRPGWAIADCRFDLADTDKGERAFRCSHIPGAVYAHVDRDLSGPITPASGRHPLPDPGAFVHWLATNGIGNRSQVVAYDDSNGSMAARLWWLLRWLGHRAVAVLDGGWQAWTAAGFPVASGGVPPRGATFGGKPVSSLVVTSRDLLDLEPGRLLVDVRAVERFRGEHEPIDALAGHIPGAVNLPLQQNLGAGGRFLEPARLRMLYEGVGAGAANREVVFMCGSGVTACHGILAREVAGLGGARLYAGSWSEWIRDPSRPVAVGPG